MSSHPLREAKNRALHRQSSTAAHLKASGLQDRPHLIRWGGSGQTKTARKTVKRQSQSEVKNARSSSYAFCASASCNCLKNAGTTVKGSYTVFACDSVSM